MVRGGLTSSTAALSLVVGLALALPVALADTKAPVQGDAWAAYEADAGALLAEAAGYDPAFRFDFTFAGASIYEVLLPAADTERTRGAADVAALPKVPTVLSARHVGQGRLALEPGSGVTLLLTNDPTGLGVDSLPLALPADPARFVVEALPPLDLVGEDGLHPDPHDLSVGSGLRYTIEGLAMEQPLRAHARGDLVAVLARGAAHVLDGSNVYAHEVGPSPEGERVLLVQARGAVVDLQGQGLTAILQFPEASLGAGAALVADLQGREVGARPSAGVASGDQGLTLLTDADLAGALLASQAADPVTGSPHAGAGAAYLPLSAEAAVAGAVLGTVVALGALGMASLWAGGRAALFGLLAPLYARLQSDEVLTNHTREAIFRHVVEHPGVNVSEVVKVFGLGWGATVYHLRVLERSHLITANKQGRQVCYFQNGGRYNGQMAGISALRNENAATVARVILERPGVQQREVCRITGLAQPTVSWHLQRLEQAGVIVGEGAPRKRYRALPPLADLAQRGFVPGVQVAPPAAAVAPAAPPASGA